MRTRALVAAGAGALVLAGAAYVPTLLTAEPTPPERDIAVPFEISGLLVTACRERMVSTGGVALDESAFDDCLNRYRVEPLSPSIYFDDFHRAMYAGYFAGELVPCLRAHDRPLTNPARDNGPPADLSSWYLRAILEDATFDEAIAAWYDCPLVPSYLEDAVRTRDGVVE